MSDWTYVAVFALGAAAAFGGRYLLGLILSSRDRPSSPVATTLPASADVAPAVSLGTGRDPSPYLRVSQRILMHLASEPRLRPGDIGLPSLTQAGMSAELEVGQGTLSRTLNRLVSAGLVRATRVHVQSMPTRLKVYQLTPHGEAIASALLADGGVSTSRPATEPPTPGRRHHP